MSVRRIVALLLVLTVALLWVVPSDVVKLIVKQDEVILGRYSENHAYIAILGSPLLLIAAALIGSRVALDRNLIFRVLSVCASVLVATVVVDIAARRFREPRYIVTAVEKRDSWPHQWQRSVIKTRPPNTKYEVRFEDAPIDGRSYPNAPRGFPPVDVTLTVDRRGFRNQTDLDEYEIVTIGDSFTEGSRVSDNEVWPVQLAKILETSVYNLGMSGTSANGYLNNLLVHLDELNPKTVLLMVYEGNDLKVHQEDLGAEQSGIENWYDEVVTTLKKSPINQAFRDFVSNELGEINSDAPVPESLALSWMPIKIEAGKGSQHYAFKPKRLLRLYDEEEGFEDSKGWKNAAKLFRDFVHVCRERDVRVIFIYAPSKPHVIMPLVERRLAPEALREFAAYKENELPEPAEFKKRFYDRIDSQEKVFLRFCETEGIECISTTAALQERATQGDQVYYTYDQHWSSLGHDVVAATVSAYLQSNQRAPARD